MKKEKGKPNNIQKENVLQSESTISEKNISENKQKSDSKKQQQSSVKTEKPEKSRKKSKSSESAEKLDNKPKKSEKTYQKQEKPVKNRKKEKGFAWFLGVCAFSVLLLFVCQFFFQNTLTGNERFFENTWVNGINVGGMTAAEAENVVLTDMLQSRKEIEIELESGDKQWKLSGNDFEVSNKIQPLIRKLARAGKQGNFFQNMFQEKKVKEEGKEYFISYSNILGNINEKIEEIVSEVEHEAVAASLVFQPDEDEVFAVNEGQTTVLVDRDALYNQIDNALKNSKKVKIEIPIIEIGNQIDLEDLKNSVAMRSEFSTSYATSSAARKNNVQKALAAFNGMIVEPGESVSFNETTGVRNEENGYKNAHIIVGGVYVDGVGGGVCQASTTLYNALLLADVEIVSVNHHTLPASYVPLSFDAMVSGGYSDLVFKNNLESPIYIKTFSDDETVSVQIFGQKFEDGVVLKRRAELVKVLPHNGDKIVADNKGEFEDKILYKGEYYRVKYPREGYESKGFLQYYKDGELVEEKEIRHDFYAAQDGVVMEGVEDAAYGMTIPTSDVKIIPPQKVTKSTEDAVRAKLEKTNPSEYNP